MSFEVVINFPRRRACPARIGAGGMKGEDDKTKDTRPAALKDKGRKTLLRSVSYEGEDTFFKLPQASNSRRD